MARNNRDCPGQDQLARYAANRLTGEEALAVGGHVNDCPTCQALLGELGPPGAGAPGAPSPEGTQSYLPPLRPVSTGVPAEEPTGERSQQPDGETRTRPGGEGGPPSGPADGPGEGLAAGDRVGDYELLGPLGEGGMGTIHKARHAHLGTIYALKLLHPRRAGDRIAIERFSREMIALGRLDHPHIVRAVDAGEQDDTHYLVMEYIDGVDLSRLVSRRGRLDVADACALARQAALGLAYIHRAGRVHRDVKPSNLMLSADGTVKVLDLGLARFGESPDEPQPSLDDLERMLAEMPANQQKLTRTNQVMGTLDYMAPEQVTDSRSVDARADIYSLGCALYALLAGRAPFDSQRYSTIARQILAHTKEPPPPIRERRPEVPEGLARVLARMLEKNPADRYASAEEVAEALAPFAAGSSPARLAGLAGADADSDPELLVAVPTVDQAPGPREDSSRPRRWPWVLALALPPAVLLAGAVLVVVRFWPAETGRLTVHAQDLPARRALELGKVQLRAVESGELHTLLPGSQELPPGDYAVLNAEPGLELPARLTVLPGQPVDVRARTVAGGGRPGRPPQPPGAAGPPVDLLSLIDLGRDAIPGHWRREGGALVSHPDVAARLQLPYEPPEDYRIEAAVERLGRAEALQFGVVVGGRQCVALVDGWPHLGFLSGPHLLQGQGLERHKHHAYRGQVVPAGKPVELACTVRNAGGQAMLRLERDGREIFTWRGAPSQLSLEDRRRPPTNRVLFFAAHQNALKVSKLRVVPLSRGGKVVRFADPRTDPDLAAAQRVLWKGGRLSEERMRFADLRQQDPVRTIDADQSPWFGGDDLRTFARLPQLRHLDLGGTEITGDDLKALDDLPKLEVLDLSLTRVSHLPPNLLAALPGLKRLDLQASLVDDTALSALAGRKQLEQVDLRYTTVSDAGLAHLAAHESLRALKLDHTNVTDKGLAVLAGLPELQELSLIGTPLSDSAVEPLSRLRNLKRLRLLGAGLTAEGVNRLRGKLPEAQLLTSHDGSIDLLKLVDLELCPSNGPWRMTERGEGTALVVGPNSPTRIQLPVRPPEEYDLEAVVHRASGNSPLVFNVPLGGRQVMVGFDHWPDRGGYVIIHGVDGRNELESPAKVQMRTFEVGQRARLTIQVRRDGIKVLREGEPVLHWQEPERLGPNSYWTIGDPLALGLASYAHNFFLTELTLRPVAGKVEVSALRPLADTADREVARWVLARGGAVTVTVEGALAQDIQPGQPLPARPFWVLKVGGLAGTPVTAADLARINRLDRLEELDLNKVLFENADLAALRDLPRLTALKFVDTRLNDEGLAHVARLPSLEALPMGHTAITDAGLAHVAKLPRLRSLGVWSTDVSDEGVDTIVRLPRLQSLAIGHTRISADALAKISRLGNLRTLHTNGLGNLQARHLAPLEKLPFLREVQLHDAVISEEAAEVIGRLKGLENLRLNHTALGDRGVDKLSGLTGLRRLKLENAGITDAALPTIAGFPELIDLSLDNNPGITDESVPHLAALKKLTALSLQGTGISPAGLSRLQADLPQCTIEVSSWSFDLAGDARLALPPPAGPPVDLLALVDLERDATPGTWKREGQSLVSVPRPGAGLLFPYIPPPEYRLEATLERAEADESVNFGLAVGDRRCLLILDGWPQRGYLSGPDLLEGRGLEQYAAHARRGPVLPDGKPVRLAITVLQRGNQATLRVERDGKHLFTWRGDRAALSLRAATEPVPPGVLFLQRMTRDLKISSLRVIPLSEGGRVVTFTREDPDRAAAERALWKGGHVWLRVTPGGGEGGAPPLQKITTWGALPEAAFKVERIDSASSPYFNGADLASFARLGELRQLNLPGIPATDRDLARFTDVPKLETLDLSRSALTDEATNHLKSLSQLRHLSLGGTSVTLQRPGDWDKLETLDLRYTPVADTEGKAAALGGLTALKRLNLDHTGMAGDGLASLARLPDLEDLSLVDTGIDDKDVEALARLKGLRRLNVLDTNLTREGVAKLQGLLPGCDILSGYSDRIDLLRLVAPNWHVLSGGWAWQDGALVETRRSLPGLVMLPIKPGEAYDVEVVARRVEGQDGLGVLLQGGGKSFLVEFDQYPELGSFTVIDMIDGKRQKENESHVQMVAFPQGETVRATIQVRPDRVVIRRNGQVLIDWPADYGRLSLTRTWQNPWPEAIGIGSYNNLFVIQEFSLRPVSGPVRSIKLQPTAHTSERETARRVLERGGRVRITLDGTTEQDVEELAALPTQPLWMTWVRLGGQQVNEPDFRDFGRLRRLKYLGLENASFEPGHLAHLAGLTDLDEVNVNGTSVADEDLKHLAPLAGLKRLRLGRTRVTGAGFQHLSRLAGLQFVQLGSAAVDREGFRHLTPFRNLRHLDLAGADIGDEELEGLKGLKQPEYLHLGWTRIKGSGLKHLADLPQLSTLLLNHTAVGDEHLPHLARMKSLRKLALNRTRVTDAGLQHLESLVSLQELGLDQTTVSEEAARRLLRSLPRCRITANGKTLPPTTKGP